MEECEVDPEDDLPHFESKYNTNSKLTTDPQHHHVSTWDKVKKSIRGTLNSNISVAPATSHQIIYNHNPSLDTSAGTSDSSNTSGLKRNSIGTKSTGNLSDMVSNDSEQTNMVRQRSNSIPSLQDSNYLAQAARRPSKPSHDESHISPKVDSSRNKPVTQEKSSSSGGKSNRRKNKNGNEGCLQS